MKTLFGFAIFVAVVYVGACAVLFFVQRSMLYYPQPRLHGETSATLPLSVAGAELVTVVWHNEVESYTIVNYVIQS